MPPMLAHRASRYMLIATAALAAAFGLALFALLSTPLAPHTLLTLRTSAGDLRLGVMGYCLDTECATGLPYDLAGAVHSATQYPLGAAYSRATAGLGMIPAAVAMTGLCALFCGLATLLPILLPALVACVLALLMLVSGSVCAWTLLGSLSRTLDGPSSWGAGAWCLVAACPLVFAACGVAAAEWVKARRRSRDDGVYWPLKGAKSRPYQF